MTGTNHALTGAMIGFSLGNPIYVIPAAVISHFVLDSLPHFGEIFEKRKRLSHAVWMVDIAVLLCFMVYLIAAGQWILLLGSFFAISPDLAWVYRFAVSERFGTLPPRPANKINTFHANIQKFETRKGLIVEIVWALGFGTAVVSIL